MITKFMNDQMSYAIKSRKNAIKEYGRKCFGAKMLSWLLEPYILPGFKMEVNDQIRIVPYNQKFPPKMDLWDRQMEIIAKLLNAEPWKEISEHSATGSFNKALKLFGTGENNYYAHRKHFVSVYVDITTANTEKCEIFKQDKAVVYKENVLTGYCKVLKDRKYLETATL